MLQILQSQCNKKQLFNTGNQSFASHVPQKLLRTYYEKGIFDGPAECTQCTLDRMRMGRY